MMRYLLVLLLAITPALAADVTIRSTEVTKDAVAECTAMFQAHQDLMVEPANGDIVTALTNATPKSFIEFSKVAYSDACTVQAVCESRTTQVCGILGGELSDKGARVGLLKNKSVCGARCVVGDTVFRIKFVCGG